MAAWFIPAVKAILPFVSPIVSAALPVFTTRKSDEATAAVQSDILQRQITELQTAASQNALHVKELAEQLQKTVTTLERGAAIAESRLRRTIVLSVATVVMSAVAMVFAALALFWR